MKRANQNLKKFKNLALACLFALMLDSSLQANTNPLTDTSKHKYHPQTYDELVELLRDEDIKLDTIDTSKITDMDSLFEDSERKDFSGIETWDVSNVTNMESMFWGAKSFNQPLESWDVSSVTDMGGMFWGAESFNQPLNKWDVSNVMDMQSMFAGAKSFKQNLDSWQINKDADTEDMFENSPLESKPPKWYKER